MLTDAIIPDTFPYYCLVWKLSMKMPLKYMRSEDGYLPELYWSYATCHLNLFLHAQQANSSGALLFPQWALIHLMLTDCFEISRAGKQQCVLSFLLHELFGKTVRLPGSKECAATMDCVSFQSSYDDWNGGLWRNTGWQCDWHCIQRWVWQHSDFLIVSQVRFPFFKKHISQPTKALLLSSRHVTVGKLEVPQHKGRAEEHCFLAHKDPRESFMASPCLTAFTSSQTGLVHVSETTIWAVCHPGSTQYQPTQCLKFAPFMCHV